MCICPPAAACPTAASHEPEAAVAALVVYMPPDAACPTAASEEPEAAVAAVVVYMPLDGLLAYFTPMPAIIWRMVRGVGVLCVSPVLV